MINRGSRKDLAQGLALAREEEPVRNDETQAVMCQACGAIQISDRWPLWSYADWQFINDLGSEPSSISASSIPDVSIVLPYTLAQLALNRLLKQRSSLSIIDDQLSGRGGLSRQQHRSLTPFTATNRMVGRAAASAI